MNNLPPDAFFEIVKYCSLQSIIILASTSTYYHLNLTSQEGVKRIGKALSLPCNVQTTLKDLVYYSTLLPPALLEVACQLKDLPIVYRILHEEYEDYRLAAEFLAKHGEPELIQDLEQDLAKVLDFTPCYIGTCLTYAYLAKGDKAIAKTFAEKQPIAYYEYLYEQGDYENHESIFSSTIKVTACTNMQLIEVLRECFIKRGDIDMLRKYPPSYNRIELLNTITLSIRYDELDIFKFLVPDGLEPFLGQIIVHNARKILEYCIQSYSIPNTYYHKMCIIHDKYEDFLMHVEKVDQGDSIPIIIRYATVDREKKLRHISLLYRLLVLNFIERIDILSSNLSFRDIVVLEELKIKPSIRCLDKFLEVAKKDRDDATLLWLMEHYPDCYTKEIIEQVLISFATYGKMYMIRKMLDFAVSRGINISDSFLVTLEDYAETNLKPYTTTYLKSRVAI